MSNVIKPYTPLYRASIDGDCACGEPIWIVPDNLFYFSLPKPVSENTSYQLVTFVNGVPYTLNFSIFIPIDNAHNYITLNIDDNGCLTLDRQTFGGAAPLTLKICPGDCVELQLRTMTPLFPDIVFGPILATYLFKVDNGCNNVMQLSYTLPCEPTFYYYYNMQGSIRRQTDLLSDEVNFVAPDGRNRRIYSRYQESWVLKSYPFGWAEHDFISRIFDGIFDINGFLYYLNEGSVWTVNNPNNQYSTGQIELIRVARQVSACCPVEEE